MTPEEKAILDELGAVDAPPKADETERILAELGAVDAPPKVSPEVRAARWKDLGITGREQAKQEAAEAKAKAAETMATGMDPDAPIADKLAHSPLVAGSAAYLGALGRSAALNAPAHVGAIDETLRNYARRAVGRPSDGKTYGQRVEDVRALERGLAEEYPIPTAIGSFVGGVTSPANKLAAPVAGLSTARNLAQAASTAGGQAALSSWLAGADAAEASKAGASALGLTAGVGGAFAGLGAAKRGLSARFNAPRPQDIEGAVSAAAKPQPDVAKEIVEAATAKEAKPQPGILGIAREELARARNDEKGPSIYGSAAKLAGGLAFGGELKAGEASQAAKKISQYAGAQAIGLERGTNKRIAKEVGSIERANKLIGDVVDDMFERGAIYGTTTGTAHRFLDELNSAGAEVGKASKALDAIVPKDAVDYRRLAKEYRRLATRSDAHHASGAYSEALRKEANRLIERADKAAEAGRRQGYSFREAHFERTRLNDALAKEASSNDRTSMAAYADMRRVISKAMDREARSVSGEAADAFKDASLRYYKYTKLQDAAANAIAREAGNKPLGLTDAILIGADTTAGKAIGAVNFLDRHAKGALANIARRTSEKWAAMPAERPLQAAEELSPGLANLLETPVGRVVSTAGKATAAVAASPVVAPAALAKYALQQPAETLAGLSRYVAERKASPLEEYLSPAATGESDEEKKLRASLHFQRGN